MYEPERPVEPPEPTPVTYCHDCGEIIYVGDGFYLLHGDPYCEECGKEWLDRRWHTARADLPSDRWLRAHGQQTEEGSRDD